jgi:hypothetical protein
MLQAFGDVVIGSVLGPSSQRANECRIAMFLAGYPETVPVRTVNRYVVVAVIGQSWMSSSCSTLFALQLCFMAILCDLARMHQFCAWGCIVAMPVWT